MSDPKISLDALRIDRGAETQRTSARGKITIIVVVFLLAITGLMLARRTTGVAVRTHTLVAAASSSGRTVLNASGYVVARRAATVSSKVTGKVLEVLVEEGMHVDAGQVLARLDDVNVRATLGLAEAEVASAKTAFAESRADLELARRELARTAELARTHITSASDLDRARTQVDVLQARLASLEAKVAVSERALAVHQQELEDTVIRAPFAGIATAKNAQPGEMISPMSAGGGFTRTGIGTIVDMSSLEIEVEVNESYLNRVKNAQKVEATLDAYPDWKMPGTVLTIIPTADRQKATVKVRVQFDQLDPRILPEMGVKVAFQADAADTHTGTVSVPKTALRKLDGKDFVFVVLNGRAERKTITVTRQRPDAIEVNAGLEPGDRVVVEGPEELKDGTPVIEKTR